MGFGTMDRFVLTLIPITFFLCVAAVLVLRPLSSRMAELLLELKKDRRPVPGSSAEVQQLVAEVHELAERLRQLEHRNEFLERILEERSTVQLPPP